MRKIKITAFTLIMTLALSFAAFASSGVIFFSDPEVTVDNNVDVLVTVDTDAAALSKTSITLKYPTDGLEFVSGDCADGGAGAIKIHTTSSGSGKAEYTLKFKALKAGAHVVAVDTYEVYDSSGKVISVSHVGSSKVTVKASAASSKDATLSSIEVYPGKLTPEFSKDVKEYAINIGLNVDALTINALPSETNARVSIEGNADLKEGENKVLITVYAQDGTTSEEYVLNVTKDANGEESVMASTAANVSQTELADGVQLSSKGKTITVFNNIPEGVVIPEGFKEGTISIDGTKVTGWVWAADENPEYCVIYGMNDQGEINFYRYDTVERTIQRYFVDAAAEDTVPLTEFNELQTKYNETLHQSEVRFIIICVVAVVAFIMLILVIYFSTRLSSYSNEFKRNQSSGRRDNNDILKHEYDNLDAGGNDETLVISRTARKAPRRESAGDETVVIRRNEPARPEPKKEPELDGFEDLEL
ncbi:MAG: cadherin-like beta sandwich domain-containing protein [Eubacteriales bacterium]|nr:cadherin-like beta sandwich domain-containing protein [Eubacteriales bacterium]